MLTVDVECWDQIIARNLTGALVPPSPSCMDMTRYLLSVLKEKDSRATFFVLGSVAEAFPDLVRRIDAEGHEIAGHGYSHTSLLKLTPDEFRRDLDRCLELLSGITGKTILGFRAPEFSIVEKTLWALDVLGEYGFVYDASIFPFAGSRYGISDFPQGVVHVNLEKGSIIEVPPSTIRFAGRRFPAAGGGYFRLLPYPLIRAAVGRVIGDDRPLVLYFHPYEFSPRNLKAVTDPSAPAWQTRKTEWRFNLLRRTMVGKLMRLLDEFTFSPICEALSDALPR